MDPRAAELLDWWFGPEPGEIRALWFTKSAQTDQEIAERFGLLIDEALAGGLAGWEAPAEAALARILLLDQFTRNVFRDRERSFAGDALALDAARALCAAGLDASLPPLRRAFVYMPFEHAEDLACQDEAVARFTRLAQEAPALQGMLDYAHKHREVIARFGRFPHRNPILGRASSPEEALFLQQPGSRF
ncbi:DUF924 family protein [Rhizobacter sp. OV335]|uniref:DUF924 family protein n=1 Tax=Rhizobacter sp. OV335 TaxID=1500264 RepID=UPI00091F2350|nr:DUF924 family protein [Rhizobacter sp. OV335]SHN35868.1 Uncharacterized conserved protein, DUF924 family [Rhizobacter sp. OV335]